MDKQKKQIIITAFLVLVMVIAWVKAIKVIKKRRGLSSKAQVVNLSNNTLKSILTQPKETVSLKSLSEDKEDESLRWVYCPFSGKTYTSSDEIAGLELNGIIWDEQEPKAIINKKIIGREEKVGKYTVRDIERTKVILSDGLQEFELKMPR